LQQQLDRPLSISLVLLLQTLQLISVILALIIHLPFHLRQLRSELRTIRSKLIQLRQTSPFNDRHLHSPITRNRHRASTSMHSLTFCVRFLLPERHQWKARIPDCRSNVENFPCRRPVAGGPAAPACRIRRAVLGAPPVARQSPAGDERRRPLSSPAGGARRPRPAGRSHYVVISRDGRKLVTRVRVMLP